MLRITEKTSAAAAKQYYKDGLARGDYYLAGQAVPSLWGGKAAELLGLHGQVDKAAFYQLCDNLKPDGTPLTVRTRADRRVAYDIVLDCPKSVSLVHAFGGDDRIMQAFREAVDETNKRIETDAQTRVRKGDRSEDRPTGNLVWATFVHDTARPVAGIPDPQLHCHTVIFNATHDPVEARFKAVQLGYIHANAPFYEAYFNNAFASKLRGLGYGFVRNGRSWELDGIDRELIERFSHRTHEILATAKRLGITDPDKLGSLGARTRDRKSSSMPWDVVQEVWASRLSPDDLTALRTAKDAGQREQPGPSPREALEHARETCLARSALVPEKVFLEAAMRFGVGHVSLADLEAELPKMGLAVRDVRGEPHIGDDARLRDEKAMLSFARETRGTMQSFFHDLVVMPKGATPKEGLALTHLSRSRDQIVLARLRPETADEVIKRLQDRQYEVTRFDGQSLRLPGDVAKQIPSSNPVWWVDHAQHLSTTEMAELFRQAGENGTRVVLVPSPGRVSRHSPLPLLGSRAGLRTPAFEAKRRAREQHREASKALHGNRPESGLKKLDALGAVVEVTGDKLADAVAEAFARKEKTAKPGKRSRVTVKESLVDDVTDAIRSALRRLRKLGRSRKFEKLLPVHRSVKERTDTSTYRRGQIVLFFRSIKGFRASQRYKVVGHDPFGNVLVRNLKPRKGLIQSAVPFVEALPMKSPKAFAVFERSTIELAKGDSIRITMSGKTQNQSFGPELFMSKRALAKNAEFARSIGLKPPDRRYRVRYGTEHRIKRFTLTGDVLLENGWVLGKDFGHWSYAYCDASDTAGSSAMFWERDRDGHARTTFYTADRDELFEAALQRQRAAEDEHRTQTAGRRNRERNRNRGMDYGS